MFSKNNYDPQWNENYQIHNFAESDPTLQHGFKSNEPMLWSEDTFKDHTLLYGEMKKFNLNHGWLQSSWYNFAAKGVITLSRSTEAITLQELDAKEAKMSKLARLTHACLSEIITLSPPYNPLEKLSAREVEILKWVADGKTGEVIGKVLGVTERTVTHHTVNIMQKLNATNKTAAAVKAALLGII